MPCKHTAALYLPKAEEKGENMNKLIIDGGRPLKGEIDINGAKNSVLPILAATLINGGENIIHNCPDLKDVDSAVNILKHLGCKVKREGKTITVDSSDIKRYDVPDKLMREMRSSVIFLGPILARCGKSRMCFPGGCELGPRPIDLHIDAARKLGVKVEEDCGNIYCTAEDMVGQDIMLSFPSVGATENIILMGTACKGVTRIKNAAREPEIDDLIAFVRKAGAIVERRGNEIEIVGNRTKNTTEHTVMPDRIETSTYLCMCAAAGGDILLKKTDFVCCETVIDALMQAGADIAACKDTIRIQSTGKLKAIKPVRTMPYPGFPTDAQAILMAAMTLAKGSTIFIETIFENRYRHTAELMRMGADIKVAGRMAVTESVKRLYGAKVKATDLRGGAALCVAGLAAFGRTEIEDIYHIDRGYERIENVISALGGRAVRE